MDIFDDIIQNIMNIIIAAGGYAVAFCALFKFFGKKAIDFFVEKCRNELKKDIEQYKSQLETVQYVTKMRYDKTLTIFQEIIDALYDVIECIIVLIPSNGKINYPNNPSERGGFISHKLDEMKTKYNKSNNLVHRYIPFIDDVLENKFIKLLEKIQLQILVFEKVEKIKQTDQIKEEDFKRTEEIETLFKDISHDIRQYLHSLEVIPS